MWLYLKPTFEALLTLEEGIDFNINRSNDVSETIKVRCLLLCGTCDLPAQCLLCSSMQYNGSIMEGMAAGNVSSLVKPHQLVKKEMEYGLIILIRMILLDFPELRNKCYLTVQGLGPQRNQ